MCRILLMMSKLVYIYIINFHKLNLLLYEETYMQGLNELGFLSK
jgi:hypothetical protein